MILLATDLPRMSSCSEARYGEFWAINLPFCPIFRGVLSSFPLCTETSCPELRTRGHRTGEGLGISEVFCGALGQSSPGGWIHTLAKFRTSSVRGSRFSRSPFSHILSCPCIHWILSRGEAGGMCRNAEGFQGGAREET
jgi:hypothetical protein